MATQPTIIPISLLLKEAVDDRVMPEFRYRRHDAHGKLFVGPAPGVNAGAQGDAADSRSRIEFGEQRQRSLATFERHRVVVDAVDRQKVGHRFYARSRQLAGVAEIALDQGFRLLMR